MKNLLLFSTLLLTSVGAFAQLTVKPNGGADSYVYVNDQIVFVKEEINLTRNAAGLTEASIYLRNQGQLIQGTDTAKNSGDGQLSVQQTSPDGNTWAYYYWCSPVGNPVAGAGNTGNRNFGVMHLYEPKPALGVTAAVISSNTPGREGSKDPMTISTRWLYTHKIPGTEAEGNYQRMNAGNNAPAGFGFTMKGLGTKLPGDSIDYEFRGRPNNGTFPIPVKAPISSVPQMTLTGNPYPSALDLNAVFYDPINVPTLSAIWYYDEDREVDSQHLYTNKPFGYGTWTPGPLGDNEGSYVKATFYIWKSNGTHNGSGGGTQTVRPDPKRYAPIGQGFMFVGQSDGDVIIKNSHRAFVKEGATGGQIFFRPTGDESSDNETTTLEDPTSNRAATPDENLDNRTPQLRLYVVFDDALTRDMLLLFSRETTDGYDRGWDGLSPGGMASDAFFPIGDDSAKLPYVIQGTNFNVDKQIPITFKLKKAGKIEVRAVEEINKPYRTAYLFDNVENTYRVLAKAGSATSSFTLPAGTYKDRFYIVFRNPNVKRDTPEEEALAQEEVMKNVDFFQNNPAQQLEVRNPNGYTIKSATVYDMTGKLVINEQNLGDDTKFTFYTGNLAEGVYLVKLLTSEDITIDYKTIVRNK